MSAGTATRGGPGGVVIGGVRLTTPRAQPEQARWTRAAGVLVFAGMALAAWWPALGSSLLAVAPAVGVAAVLVAGRMRLRVGAALFVAWIFLAVLLAGLPLGVLRPGELGSTLGSLSRGWHTLGLPGRSGAAHTPWAVATALLAFGSSWLMAGLVATQHGRASSGLAYLLCAVPFVAAAVLGQATDAAWHGAALLGATLLWMTRGRPGLAVVGAAAIAVVALLGAQAIGPQDRWLAFGGPQKAPFNELETQQTYGPLENRRTGSTMLEVTAAQPALWRMQVFDRFDGRGFSISRFGDQELTQPRARTVSTKVKVVGLKNRLIVSAGRVTSVDARQEHRSVFGEGTELTPGPDKGDTYTVDSQVVDATGAQLAKVRIPSSTEYDRWTRFFAPPPSPIPRPAAALADNLPPGYEGTPLAGVLQLSRKLSKGVPTELEVVKRVEAYLKDPDRFTYTTDVEPGGDQPLADFLLKTRRGYCQHFAGAAALLLRLAGVPTRVVAGFATGQTDGHDTYKVTDDDAHAWIEVYFPGYGWVPFNPTPAAADAVIPASLDIFAPPAGRFATVSGAALPGVIVVLAAVAGGGWWFTRRRRVAGGDAAAAQLGDLLARLVPGPVPPGATLSRLAPQLAAIGPTVAGLAARVERERFAAVDDAAGASRGAAGAGGGTRRAGADAGGDLTRPRLELWRALRRDAGTVRATTALLRRR